MDELACAAYQCVLLIVLQIVFSVLVFSQHTPQKSNYTIDYLRSTFNNHSNYYYNFGNNTVAKIW